MKKIPTLFERVYDGHKIVDILPKITEGCEEAFLNGKATIKIDGSCCYFDGSKWFKRYDAKKGKPIPEDAIKCQEEADPVTGHLPCWIPIKEDNPADKWFLEASKNARPFNPFVVCPEGTYEAIGPHFQGNPYKLDKDMMVRHGWYEVSGPVLGVKRTFEGVREWLSRNYQEGIVFWLDGKPVCKIKRTDFGLEWNGKETKR